MKDLQAEIQEQYQALGISEPVRRLGEEVLAELAPRFARIDEIAEYNQLKVLGVMRKNRVSESHLTGTTGYGYNDDGRDTLERVYAPPRPGAPAH